VTSIKETSPQDGKKDLAVAQPGEDKHERQATTAWDRIDPNPQDTAGGKARSPGKLFFAQR
jgi:hypothetical protein